MRVPFRVMMITIVLAGIHVLGPQTPMAGKGEAGPTLPLSSNVQPDATIEHFRMTETRKGKRIWKVEADWAEVFEEQGLAILVQVVHPVRIVMYHGEETLTSFAEKVVVNLKTKDLQLIGQVRSESSEGTRIFGKDFTWVAEKRQISTDAPVVIEKKGLQIRGKGMVADTIQERVTFHGPIYSQITLSGKWEQAQ